MEKSDRHWFIIACVQSKRRTVLSKGCASVSSAPYNKGWKLHNELGAKDRISGDGKIPPQSPQRQISLCDFERRISTLESRVNTRGSSG